MNVDRELKHVLHARLDPLEPPDFATPLATQARSHRSRFLLIATASLAGAILAGGVAIQTLSNDGGVIGPMSEAPSSSPSPSPSPTPTPSVTSTVDAVACIVGPWATFCPEARWARDVALAAGYSVTGDTGSALEIGDGANAFHFWAFEPENASDRQGTLEAHNYELLMEIDSTPVFFDGIRLTWETQGLEVWLTDQEARHDAPEEAVARIVRASFATPYHSAPELALSDSTVGAADVIDLHVNAATNYTWGVQTSLDVFRDGEWVTLYYWSTWLDEPSTDIEPVSADEGNAFPAIGFVGSASFRIRIPDVPSGEYRISKDFTRSGYEPIEERSVTAEAIITVTD